VTWHHLAAFLIVGCMVWFCAKLHMTDQQFNGVLQLGAGMVGVVGGVAVGIKIATRPEKQNGNGHSNDGQR
jgi:hypothetical protein